MARNGKRAARRAQISAPTPAASPQEAAAIAAAVQQFLAETAGPPVTEPRSRWLEAALREGVSRAQGVFPGAV